ncbi:MAG TPA: hypothetical protein VF100_10665 [Thermoanaerobaculia bacterium]
MTKRSLRAAALAGALPLLLLVACDSSDSPTAPPEAAVLARAAVSVDGQTYNGGTYHGGGRSGTSTMFEAHLERRDGTPMPGEQVWVEHHKGMMGGGRFRLYDDGTHGDPIGGDGIYCFEDFAGTHGFHHQHAWHGEHHYDFWGQHDDGSHSNHRRVTVRVED